MNIIILKIDKNLHISDIQRLIITNIIIQKHF